MREVKEILTCDICKKESDELFEVNLPYEKYIDTTVSLISYTPSGKIGGVYPLEICPECAMKIYNKIKEVVLIEDIPWVGFKVTEIE